MDSIRSAKNKNWDENYDKQDGKNEEKKKVNINQTAGGKKKGTEIWHPGFDARFPNMNQTRRCSRNYVDFFRCQNRFGEDPRCEYFRKAYIHLCPDFWIERWDEQREMGTFPSSLD